MRPAHLLTTVLLLAAIPSAQCKKTTHQWLLGKILDESQARYFAGMLHNSSSQTSENGAYDGNANSVSYGDTTNTQINGGYSGTRTTSTSGSSIAIYRVYDNLIVEGQDTVYVTSERLRWRWSKGAHVAVNGTVRYYVSGRKLHILDDDNKEHTIEIVKEIKKTRPVGNQAQPIEAPDGHSTEISPPAQSGIPSVPVAIESTPTGGDIEIDGGFVGNTPSTVTVTAGSLEITVKKTGFADWSRKLNVTGGNIHLDATLEQAHAQ